MAGVETRAAVLAQPELLRRVTAAPLAGSAVFTGCGSSFHAAQTAGPALQALEAVLAPPAADVLVCISHEGTTPLTREAAHAFPGRTVAVTAAAAESPLARECDEVVLVPGPVEESWCHTRSYTGAVATLAALRGEDVSWLADAVEQALGRDVGAPPSGRVVVAGAGRDWPTAQEAALKLREGARLPAEAHETEQLLHGHLAAIDETVRAYVLEGEGRAAERARDAVHALEALGCETTLLPTRHPAVDIVFFQLLTLAAAEARGVDPDRIRRDDPRWRAARATYA